MFARAQNNIIVMDWKVNVRTRFDKYMFPEFQRWYNSNVEDGVAPVYVEFSSLLEDIGEDALCLLREVPFCAYRGFILWYAKKIIPKGAQWAPIQAMEEFLRGDRGRDGLRDSLKAVEDTTKREFLAVAFAGTSPGSFEKDLDVAMKFICGLSCLKDQGYDALPDFIQWLEWQRHPVFHSARIYGFSHRIYDDDLRS